MASKTTVNKNTAWMSINTKKAENHQANNPKEKEDLIIGILNWVFVEPFYEQYQKD